MENPYDPEADDGGGGGFGAAAGNPTGRDPGRPTWVWPSQGGPARRTAGSTVSTQPDSTDTASVTSHRPSPARTDGAGLGFQPGVPPPEPGTPLYRGSGNTRRAAPGTRSQDAFLPSAGASSLGERAPGRGGVRGSQPIEPLHFKGDPRAHGPVSPQTPAGGRTPSTFAPFPSASPAGRPGGLQRRAPSTSDAADTADPAERSSASTWSVSSLATNLGPAEAHRPALLDPDLARKADAISSINSVLAGPQALVSQRPGRKAERGARVWPPQGLLPRGFDPDQLTQELRTDQPFEASFEAPEGAPGEPMLSSRTLSGTEIGALVRKKSRYDPHLSEDASRVPSRILSVFQAELHRHQRQSVNWLYDRYMEARGYSPPWVELPLGPGEGEREGREERGERGEGAEGGEKPEDDAPPTPSHYSHVRVPRPTRNPRVCTLGCEDEEDRFKVLRGCILGHDMGLGKTVITCFFLRMLFLNVVEEECIRTAIIVVPLTIMGQWQKHLTEWCPGVPVYAYHGLPAVRKRILLEACRQRAFILLTTYATAAQDLKILEALEDRGPRSRLLPPSRISTTQIDARALAEARQAARDREYFEAGMTGPREPAEESNPPSSSFPLSSREPEAGPDSSISGKTPAIVAHSSEEEGSNISYRQDFLLNYRKTTEETPGETPVKGALAGDQEEPQSFRTTGSRDPGARDADLADSVDSVENEGGRGGDRGASGGLAREAHESGSAGRPATGRGFSGRAKPAASRALSSTSPASSSSSAYSSDYSVSSDSGYTSSTSGSSAVRDGDSAGHKRSQTPLGFSHPNPPRLQSSQTETDDIGGAESSDGPDGPDDPEVPGEPPGAPSSSPAPPRSPDSTESGHNIVLDEDSDSAERRRAPSVLVSRPRGGGGAPDTVTKPEGAGKEEKPQKQEKPQKPKKPPLTFDVLVMDEATAIKNPDSRAFHAMATLPVRFRLALTGTPVMNNLSELWSIVQCLNPGYLGAQGVFLRFLQDAISISRLRDVTPREKVMGTIALNRLTEVLDPMMLRMTKDSLKALSVTKTELILWTPLSPLQNDLYDAILGDSHFQDELSLNMDSKMVPFQLISYLRKTAGHPLKMTEEDARFFSSRVQEMLQDIWDMDPSSGNKRLSSKMNLLAALCKHLHREGRRVLIFSEHTTTLDIIQDMLESMNYSFLRVDGTITKTSERTARCERFNKDPKIFAFLLTIGVGGYGLNLTGADRVIIFEPVWNPLLEKQAIGRAYRIRQRHNVIIYRLVSCNTIEERLTARQLHKTALANCVVDKVYLERLVGRNDIMDLFNRNPGGPDVCVTADIMRRYLKPWDTLRRNLTREEFDRESEFLHGLLSQKMFVRLGLYEDVEDKEGTGDLEKGEEGRGEGDAAAGPAKGPAGESEADSKPTPKSEPAAGSQAPPSLDHSPVAAKLQAEGARGPGSAHSSPEGDGSKKGQGAGQEAGNLTGADLATPGDEYASFEIMEKEVPTIRDLRKFQTARLYNKRSVLQRPLQRRAKTKRDAFEYLHNLISGEETSEDTDGSDLGSTKSPAASEIVDLTGALEDTGREPGGGWGWGLGERRGSGFPAPGPPERYPPAPTEESTSETDSSTSEAVPEAVDARGEGGVRGTRKTVFPVSPGSAHNTSGSTDRTASSAESENSTLSPSASPSSRREGPPAGPPGQDPPESVYSVTESSTQDPAAAGPVRNAGSSASVVSVSDGPEPEAKRLPGA